VELRASPNIGLSGVLAENFPNIKPVERPKVELTKNINITLSKTKTGFAVKIKFKIVQHIRDSSLLINIQRWGLGCGNPYSSNS
jgi:hypothetical protein